MPRFCLATVFLCSMLFTSAYGQQREMELNGKNENEIDLKYLFFGPPAAGELFSRIIKTRVG